MTRDEQYAQLFHETYERLAPAFHYDTRKASAVPWDKVPNTNRNLMIAVAKEVSQKIIEDTNSMKLLGAHVWEISKSSGFTKPGWEDTYGIPAQLMLIISEVAEALEAFRIDDRINFAEEIADVIIRTLGLCARLEIDIDKEIRDKIEKNKNREHKHGGKRL